MKETVEEMREEVALPLKDDVEEAGADMLASTGEGPPERVPDRRQGA